MPTTKRGRDPFEMAGSPEAAPRVTPGATICDTDESIKRFQMITVLHGLKLESKGIRVNRQVSMLMTARKLFGIKAKDAATAYDRLRAKMIEAGVISDRPK